MTVKFKKYIKMLPLKYFNLYFLLNISLIFILDIKKNYFAIDISRKMLAHIFQERTQKKKEHKTFQREKYAREKLF